VSALARRSPDRSRRSGATVGGQDGISLVELLVAMSIMAVITAMILLSWFALQKSFAQTSSASQSREFARDAVARMTQEIRDAQGSDQGSAITQASANTIVFYSTYNMAGNNDPNSTPRQTAFVYVVSGTAGVGSIYRVVETNGTTLSDELANPAQYGRVVVKNVVNAGQPDTVNHTTTTSVFRYWTYDAQGNYGSVDSVPDTGPGTVRAVDIHVLVDLNPGHSPVYMDLQTTAQPRNMRPAT